jgi:2-methylisocitrate lyase-like PEP mutase family enzyme
VTAFADLHRAPFLLPNAWDVASGLLLADAGFVAVGTTSLGVTAAAGLLDGTGAGAAATVALGGALAAMLPVPVTVDLEGGYSEDPAEVAGLAARLAAAGVAGINLEDSYGGGLREPAHHAAVIAAVRAAAPDLFVNARTDTMWLRLGGLDETITRLRAYADAGAHGTYVPGLSDVDGIARVAAAVPLPLNVLWSPDIHPETFWAAGAIRVSTGSAPYRRALAAAVELARGEPAASGPAGGASAGVPAGSAVPYPHLQALLAAGQDRAARR